MPRRLRSLRTLTLLTAAFAASIYPLPVTVGAQTLASKANVPVRELGPAQSVSNTSFGLILQLHSFTDGRVLVNDGGARRLLLLNKSLMQDAVLLDSLNGASNFYGPRATPIIRFTADSALFVDGRSSTLLLISPAGTITRTLALPKPSDVAWISSSASGIDARGNLVYRGRAPITRPLSEGPAVRTAPASHAELMIPDSMPIVRASFDTRTLTTVANLAWPTTAKYDERSVNGQFQKTVFHNPVPVYDEWTVTSEGLIAIVRGEGYLIELVDADGKRVADAKLPFDWRALSDSDRQHLLDSARSVFDPSAPQPAGNLRTPSGGSILLRSPTTAGGPAPPPPAPPNHIWATTSDLPSYLPPIRLGAVSADLDGNVWILPTSSSASSNGALVYDVVNNKGILTQRVRLPVGRVIVGFGRAGVVYTSVKQETGGWTLEARALK